MFGMGMSFEVIPPSTGLAKVVSMKKIIRVLLAAALVLGAAQQAAAVDFKAKGVWLANFQYGQNGNFTNKGHSGYDNSEDEFEARSRVRLQLDAVASENLMGEVYFEIGKSIWGKGDNPQGGAAMGADGTIVKVKRAFLDWTVPSTDLRLRMGIQGLQTPYMALDGPTVLSTDLAAITASYAINDNVALTAFWARPYNDNYTGDADGLGANYMDNMDIGGLFLPLTFDGLRLTPWAMYSAIGPNTLRKADDYVSNRINGVNGNYFFSGMLPVMANVTRHTDRKLNSYANAWWAGLAGDVTLWDPFRIAWEFTYGSVRWDDDPALDRRGWLAALLLEYKMDWGTPGIYGWYGSGDDDNLGNGSERLPTISNDYGVSSFSQTYSGVNENGLERDRAINNNLAGTWGFGARLKDVSFLEDIRHTLHVSFFGGTNDSGILSRLHDRTGSWMAPNNPDGTSYVGRDNVYMTQKDYAFEVGLSNKFKIYDNLRFNLDVTYVTLWLDKSDNTWGRANTGGGSNQIRDAWNISTLFIYSF